MGWFWKPKTPKPEVRTVTRWGLLWHSDNSLDGERVHICMDRCLPVMFVTRREARAYAKTRYGYIAKRADLRVEPHGWTVPRPVRLTVAVS